MSRITVFTLLLVLVMLPGWVPSAVAQVGRAAIGGAVGVGGGVVITVSVIVARARFQGEYLESIDDLYHWQTTPMLLTPAVGVMFGLAGRDPLVASVIGSTSGMAIGTALGAGLGWMLSNQQEAPWAGGVIGAGIGMTVGGLFLGFRAWLRDSEANPEEAEALRMGIRIPI